jgi:hypothetical protein
MSEPKLECALSSWKQVLPGYISQAHLRYSVCFTVANFSLRSQHGHRIRLCCAQCRPIGRNQCDEKQ